MIAFFPQVSFKDSTNKEVLQDKLMTTFVAVVVVSLLMKLFLTSEEVDDDDDVNCFLQFGITTDLTKLDDVTANGLNDSSASSIKIDLNEILEGETKKLKFDTRSLSESQIKILEIGRAHV